MEKSGSLYPKVGNKLQMITSSMRYKQHNKSSEVFSSSSSPLLVFHRLKRKKKEKEIKIKLGACTLGRQTIKKITLCSENRSPLPLHIPHPPLPPKTTTRSSACLCTDALSCLLVRHTLFDTDIKCDYV